MSGATRHGILLVFDEVQSGIGRTGRPFAAETFGVHARRPAVRQGRSPPGCRSAGIIASRAVFDRWPTGTHGSTFGGNPVSCAAALATLDVLEEEDLYERAAVLGDRARARLAEVARMPTCVDGPRRRADDRRRARQRRDRGRRAASAASTQALIVLTCGPDENVLRLIPPLTITDADLDLGLEILVTALRFAGDRMGQSRA